MPVLGDHIVLANGGQFTPVLGGQFAWIFQFDASIENLNDTQVKTRIRKLMGFNTEIKIGRFDEFSSEIFEMAKIKATQQTFGKYYFQNKKNT